MDRTLERVPFKLLQLVRRRTLLTLLLLGVGSWLAWIFLSGAAESQTILLLGVDEDKSRTDVVIVAHLNPALGIANLLSVPRDTLVQIDCGSLKNCLPNDKLAHAHVYGGPKLTVKAVERLLSIPMDGYVRFDFQGFANVVDSLGGVDLLIEEEMYYDDPTANPPLQIRFSASKEPQHLDGEQALNYIRYRDNLGDIGRTVRSRKFLVALAQTARKNGTVARLPSLVAALYPYVKTDISLGIATALARTAPKIDSSKIQAESIPGEPATKEGLWVWEADPEKTAALVDRLFRNPKP